MTLGYRRFTREFKEATVRTVEEGTPLKRVARVHGIDPAVVRAWRAELRDLGPQAFSQNGVRRFSKEMKESAVKRVEQGTPLKEVARACRVYPNQLRQWRSAWRALGSCAFDEKEPRTKSETKLVIFRLNEHEHSRLKEMAKAAGARSLSAFARCRLVE